MSEELPGGTPEQLSEEELQRRLGLLDDLECQKMPFDIGELLVPLAEALSEDLSRLDRLDLEDTIAELKKMRNARKEERERPQDLVEAEIRVLNKAIMAFQGVQDEDVLGVTENGKVKDLNREG